MTPGKPWTLRRVDRVLRAIREGTSTKTVAEQEGCTVNNLHKRLRTAGYDPKGARAAEASESLSGGQIYAMRKAGQEFREIAVAVGMEPNAVTVRRLYMRLVRYCERAEVPYPRHHRPAGAARPALTDAMLANATQALVKHAALGETLDNISLSVALRAPVRETKMCIAELRRRGVVANGVVPTPAGIRENAKIDEAKTSVLAVLRAVVSAWTSSAPCETLSSLCAKLPFTRSAINLALVRLRDDGYLAPRGLLYLREHHD